MCDSTILTVTNVLNSSFSIVLVLIYSRQMSCSRQYFVYGSKILSNCAQHKQRNQISSVTHYRALFRVK